MSQLKPKQLKLTAAGDLLIGGVGGTGTTVTAAGNTDKVLRIVSGAPAWSVNDHLVSSTALTSIVTSDAGGVVIGVPNAGATAIRTMATFVPGSVSDEALKFSTTAGNIAISATGSATDVNIVIAPQGNGDVIIGNSGGGIIQSDDAQDLKLQGGNGGGNLFLLGGSSVTGVNGGVAGKIYYATDASVPSLEVATIGAVASAVAAAVITPARTEFGGDAAAFTLAAKTIPVSIIAYINGSLIETMYYTYSITTNNVTFQNLPYTLDSNDKVVFTYEITA